MHSVGWLLRVIVVGDCWFLFKRREAFLFFNNNHPQQSPAQTNVYCFACGAIRHHLLKAICESALSYHQMLLPGATISRGATWLRNSSRGNSQGLRSPNSWTTSGVGVDCVTQHTNCPFTVNSYFNSFGIHTKSSWAAGGCLQGCIAVKNLSAVVR